MTADTISLALYVLFIVAAAALPFYILGQTRRQVRGTFGRPYGHVVRDAMAETSRRSDLLLRLVEAREIRLARLQRRAEGGR